jgi:hypothetical protein
LTLNSLDESVAGFAFLMAAGVARLTRFSFIGVYILITFMPVTWNPAVLVGESPTAIRRRH